MNRLHSTSLLFVLCAAAACSTQPDDREPTSTASLQESSHALDLMLSGEWSGREFPAAHWNDVERLLDRVGSTTPLQRFPQNPLSSQMQPTCAEGVMALWMIESVRLAPPPGFPSLNPLLLGGPDSDASWQQISDRNTPIAVAAYRAWWDRVADLPSEERRAVDPLAGTGIAWFGSAAPR